MFYLFILESIGTSELLMIGLVALIIFGPRKLPQMIRTIGKTMAEFRRSTDDFKRTWEKEANFDDNEFSSIKNSDLLLGNQPVTENSIGRNAELKIPTVIAPEIREVSRDDFPVSILNSENTVEKSRTDIDSADKRNWL